MANKKKTNVSSGISYQGFVTITKKYKNKVIDKQVVKNMGTIKLLEGIASFLSGNPNFSDYGPKYLAAYSSTEAPTAHQVVFNNEITFTENKRSQLNPVLVKIIPNETACTINFHSVISYLQTGAIIRALSLCSSMNCGTGNALAYITLDNSPIQLGTNESVSIDWEMKLENKVVSATNNTSNN